MACHMFLRKWEWLSDKAPRQVAGVVIQEPGLEESRWNRVFGRGNDLLTGHSHFLSWVCRSTSERIVPQVTSGGLFPSHRQNVSQINPRNRRFHPPWNRRLPRPPFPEVFRQADRQVF